MRPIRVRAVTAYERLPFSFREVNVDIWRTGLALVLALCGALPAFAQVPTDTVTVPAPLLVVPADSGAAVIDTTALAAPDSLVQDRPDTLARPPVGFAADVPGRVVVPALPARLPVREATEILDALPGSFAYDFGELGWPDGWSPYGLPPTAVTLRLDGRPFDDLITGRPRYDLLPLAFLTPLRVGAGWNGAAATVLTQIRPFVSAEPLTELRYQTGGMQSVSVAHTQRRRRPFLGRAGILTVLAGYHGHGVEGEYPGSRLARARQLYGRLRYEQAGWSAELSNLHTRWQLGAHGGVLVPSGPFETIYNRFIAVTEHPDAERQTIRNDLALTLRFRAGLTEPLTLSAFSTSDILRYTNPREDTLATRVRRRGVHATQPLQIGAQRLHLTAEAWRDALVHSNALPDSIGLSRSYAAVGLRDSLSLLGIGIEMEARYQTGEASFPTLALNVRRAIGPVTVFAEGQRTGGRTSLTDRYGYGRFVVAPSEAPLHSSVQSARGGLTVEAGPLRVTAFGFANRTEQPTVLLDAERTDYVSGSADSVLVATADASFERVGLGGELGLRADARRGLYALIRPTVVAFRNEEASDLHQRAAAALPGAFGEARLGVRVLLFAGDLDADLSIRGRAWSAFRSRALHPPTGLLTLPSAEDLAFGPSGTLDVYFVGGVRTATVFVTYENILSGTTLQAGTLLVPVYPLPERRVRFGVFWPILN